MQLDLTLTVEFTAEQLAEFMRPISGDGGGQQFVRYCQHKVQPHIGSPGGKLTLRHDDVNRWFKYRDSYGGGGFQSRLGRVGEQGSLL